MKCLTCKKTIKQEWRKDAHTIKTIPLAFCSRSCANNRGKRSQETKIKISKALSGKPRHRKKTFNENICPVCGDSYMTQAGYSRKSCSRNCSNYLLSLSRQNFLKENGNFCTPRESFSYKDLSIEVDSNLEKAAIVYLYDNLSAKRIERYNSILNYWEGEAHRTFNPDFICQINNETCIIEVKQRWNKISNHKYNRTIPLKYLALKKFCEEKKYRMIWIDFNSVPELKKIYNSILLNR